MKNLLTILLALFISFLNAQTVTWVPYGQQAGGATKFVWNSAKTKLYKGTYFNGIYMSLDSGMTWQNIYPSAIGGVMGVDIRNDTLFAEFDNCSIGGVRYTPNNGLNWYRIDNNISPPLTIYDLAVNSQTVFVAAYDAIYYTSDLGLTWQSHNVPFTGGSGRAYSCCTNGSLVCVGGSGCVHFSYDNGTTWTTHVIPGSQYHTLWSVYLQGSTIFAGTTSGLYRSTDFGNTWALVGLSGANVLGINFFGQFGFAGTSEIQTPSYVPPRVYFSNNSGNSWTVLNSGLGVDDQIWDFTSAGTKVIAGNWGDGMYFTNFFPLGVNDDISQKNNMAIYPNPAKNYITIETDKFIDDVQVYNVQGSCFLNTTIKNRGVNHIDLSNIPSGIYFIKANEGDHYELKSFSILR